jgi:cytoskeletal protein CcmA (bactofilin family)
MANLKSELKTIRRGAVYQNKDIFDGGMLLKAAKQFLEDNRYPEITISIDTISILDSSELKSKWSNLKIGDYIYIYINELELFIKAQIQDLKYNFETYKLGMTITNRNEYTPGVLGKLGKMFMKVKDESQNILITGKNTNSKPTPPRRGAPLGSNFGGVLINTEGQVETPEPEQASQNSSESVQTSTHPMTNQEQGYPAPHLEGTVITQGYMNVTPGALVVTNNNRETIITISAGEGIVAEKFKIDLEGNATFAGNLQAAGGTFSGDLSAAGGTFSGDLSAAGGTFAGNLQAAGGTFSGNLSAAGGTFSGDLSAAGGTFSGNLSAAGGTFSGDLQASDGSFGSITVEPTGSITVGNIVISNSGIIATNGVTPNPTQTFNLNATNGDLTITGGLSAASAVQFSDVNVSINQHTYGYEQPGIFLGVIEQDGLKERFSIVGPGINPNYLK